MALKKKSSFVLLGILIILLGFTAYVSIMTLYTTPSPIVKDNILNETKDLEKPKSSATYTSNLTVDNTGTNNWAWAITQAWCSGSGTPGDPYLINGDTIQFNNSLNGEYACINISNSHDVYFKISNCNVRNNASDYGIGISLSNCTNGIIDTVTASNNGDDGIYIIDSRNITIDSSTMNSNHHYGLNMDNTTISTITTTTMNLNLGGAYLVNSTYNIFQTTCNFNNNTYGLILIDSDLNNITACHFYNNTNWGVEILNSDQNHLFNSIIEDNIIIGVYIYDEAGDSSQNLIKGNTFTTNGKNAEDNSTGLLGNLFNSSSVGNTWDDVFTSQGIRDLDDDGVGDTPYNISGTAGSKDYLPVLNDGDDIAPAITIVAPGVGIRFIDRPQFILSVVEAVGVYNRWYTVDSGTHNTTFTGSSGTLSFSAWDSVSGSSGQIQAVILTFYINDTSGNIGSASVRIQKYFLPVVEHGENEEEEYMYALSQNQIYVMLGFAFSLSLILRLITLRGRKP